MGIDDLTNGTAKLETEKSGDVLDDIRRLLKDAVSAYYDIMGMGGKVMASKAYFEFLSNGEPIFALTIAEEAKLPILMIKYARNMARRNGGKLQERPGNAVRTYMDFLERGSYDHALSVSSEAGLPEVLSQYARHMSAIQSSEKNPED